MKEMIMWDKYDNKYREVVDVEVARGLEADLYEANNRIVDYMDIIEERDRIINLMLDTLIGLDSDVEIVRKMASINTKEKKEHLLGIYEKRCNDANN